MAQLSHTISFFTSNASTNDQDILKECNAAVIVAMQLHQTNERHLQLISSQRAMKTTMTNARAKCPETHQGSPGLQLVKVEGPILSSCTSSNTSLKFMANSMDTHFNANFSNCGSPSDQSKAHHAPHNSLPAVGLGW